MQHLAYTKGEQAERPWGSWLVEDIFPGAILKRITVLPGKRLSLQRHTYRSERWVVVLGEATVQIGETYTTLQVGDSVTIPAGAVHRLSNEGREILHIIEFQYGNLLSEEDIERLEDDYGRHEEGSASS